MPEVSVVPAIDRAVIFYIGGDIEVKTTASANIHMPFKGTIKKAYVYMRTAPTGTTAIFDVNKNGSTIFAAASKLTVAIGATTGTSTSFTGGIFATEDILSTDVDQIGSTVAGGDVTVWVLVEPQE